MYKKLFSFFILVWAFALAFNFGGMRALAADGAHLNYIRADYVAYPQGSYDPSGVFQPNVNLFGDDRAYDAPDRDFDAGSVYRRHNTIPYSYGLQGNYWYFSDH